MSYISEEISKIRRENNLYRKIYCTYDENMEYQQLCKDKKLLPSGIIAEVISGSQELRFYRNEEVEFSMEDTLLYISLKQMGYLKTIKGYLTFYFVMTIIGIFIYLIAISMNI